MRKMGRKLLVLFVLVVAVVLLSALVGCSAFRPPAVNAGYYIENKPGAHPTLIIGSNNSQANAIHAPIGETAGGAEGQPAEASRETQSAKSSGLFVNNAVGDKHADIDATAALEVLSKVRGASAGQTQTTSQGDESPASGTQTQTPSHTQSDTTTIAVPVSVGQQGPTATAGQTVEKAEDSQAEQP